MFNIFFLVFAAMAVGALLAVFVSRRSPKVELHRVIPEPDALDSHETPLVMADLQNLANALVSENSLEIKEKMQESATEEYWIVESANPISGGRFCFGFRQNTADEPYSILSDILQFKDLGKSFGASKGFFFTSWFFSSEVRQPLEGIPVTLYNCKKIVQELSQRSIPLKRST